MENSLAFNNTENFYKQLLEFEARNQDYCIDTGISEAKDLPLRLLHHVGISKDDVAHVQHKVVEESA